MHVIPLLRYLRYELKEMTQKSASAAKARFIAVVELIIAKHRQQRYVKVKKIQKTTKKNVCISLTVLTYFLFYVLGLLIWCILSFCNYLFTSIDIQ